MWPYSAEKAEVSTLNSLMASTLGRRSTSDSRTEDICTPSSVTELDSGRIPLTEKVTLVVAPPWSVEVSCTPLLRSSREKKSRPLRGSALISFSWTIWLMSGWSVCRSVAAPETSTVSWTRPSSRTKSVRSLWSTTSVTGPTTLALNPSSSTLMS